jgi:hypothetical protein
MKLVTKLIVASTLATFMFATINVTWGNKYENSTTDELGVTNSFGVWMDVNDSMSFGWEGQGIKVGFEGPAGMTVRLGYDTQETVGTTLGMSRTWWTSTGDGWGTNLSTALDWGVAGTGSGTWALTMNLGFGF